MKKIYPLIFTLFILFSCEKNDISSNVEKTVNQDLPVVKKILELGYKIEDIEDCKEFYLIQGDIIFSKNLEDYKENDNKTFERHASTNNLVSPQNRIITVRIDSSIPQTGKNDWRSAITEAMTKWNNIPETSIKFVSYYGTNPDILIKSDNNTLPNATIAAAGFPNNNGKAYREILINFDYSSNKTVSESSKIYNIVHELGHCIGFRHTNWDIPERNEGIGPYGANLIPNTPSQDLNSVMNGGTADFSWNGFSKFDIIAVKYLYPSISCSYRLEGPGNIENRCAFERYNDPIKYNVYLVGTNDNDDTIPTWTITGNSLEITKSYRYHCNVEVKPNNTTWPAIGTVTMRKGNCSTTFNVKLNNCKDMSYSD